MILAWPSADGRRSEREHTTLAALTAFNIIEGNR